MAVNYDEFRTTLNADPGNPVFPEFAEILRAAGQYDEAIFVALAGLSANQSSLKGRVILARLYFEKGYVPFAVRELETLRLILPQNQALNKLLARLSPKGVQPSSEESTQTQVNTPAPETATIAEAEFDFDELQMITDELSAKKN